MTNKMKWYKGCWNKPLEQINTYKPITVFIIDLENKDDVVDTIDLDLANHADRKTLGRITFTATENGYSVETMSREDAYRAYQSTNQTPR
jgi:hypothetical protein